ncbi:MAG: hypothetical protein R3A79_07395 [Nannocystaceae bacterium]
MLAPLLALLFAAAPPAEPAATPSDGAPPVPETVGLSVAYYGETFTHPGVVAAAVFMPETDAVVADLRAFIEAYR